jgi:hypothetical protein
LRASAESRVALRAAVGLILCTRGAGAQAACTRVGSERWTVKTMAPHSRVVKHAFTAVELGAFPAPPNIDQPHEKNKDSRYTEALADGLHEGDYVSVKGWVQLIKTAPDDCDYHIQITPDKAGTTGTIILEIPAPDPQHVTNATLRTQLQKTRDGIKRQLRLTKEPGGGNHIDGRAYMEFRGALFFDGYHYPNCDGRGTGTKAVTCWEIHPVTKTAFAVKPP